MVLLYLFGGLSTEVLKILLASVHKAPSSPVTLSNIYQSRAFFPPIPSPNQEFHLLSIESTQLIQKYMAGAFLRFCCHPKNNTECRFSVAFKNEYRRQGLGHVLKDSEKQT